MTRAKLAASILAAVALAPAGCGANTAATDVSPAPALTVSAAASLKAAFTAYGHAFDAGKARFSFAGSDELAAQIRKGVKPDVFAAANTKLPDALYTEGRVAKPVVFAGNRLVIAVPAGSRIRGVADLAKPGTKVVIGAQGVPVGDYARKLLARLPATESKAILANIRSAEPDVKGVVGKLTQGAADAGFVYVTDVKASGGKVRAVELPKSLQPNVTYGIAVVKGAKQPAVAREFIAGLLGGCGLAAMKAAGFAPPPSK